MLVVCAVLIAIAHLALLALCGYLLHAELAQRSAMFASSQRALEKIAEHHTTQLELVFAHLRDTQVIGGQPLELAKSTLGVKTTETQARNVEVGVNQALREAHSRATRMANVVSGS